MNLNHLILIEILDDTMASPEVVAKGSSSRISYFLGGLCFIGLCLQVVIALYFFGETGFWVAWGLIGFGVFPSICIYAFYVNNKEENYRCCHKCNKTEKVIECRECGAYLCKSCIDSHICFEVTEKGKFVEMLQRKRHSYEKIGE